MEYPFLKLLRIFLCAVSITAVANAERGVVVIHVSDVHNQPVAGVELAAKGSSEPGTTDRFGRTRIKLDPQTKVNDWVAIQILKSPSGIELVLISPWDAHAQVPPFENETTNFLHLVVASRSDRALLESGAALTAIVARINRANSKLKDAEPEKGRRESLETIAKIFGLPPGDVDKAIRAWGERASDPYEKGLVDLYEKNYPVASEELSQSLEMREKQLQIAQTATADAAFFLGQSRYEEGKYRESVSAYKKAMNLRPNDSTTINNLAASLQEAGDYSGAESLYRQALVIDEKDLSPDDPDLAADLNNLGILLKTMGQYEQAEPFVRRALTIAEKTLGHTDRRVATALSNLAEVLAARGDLAGAEPLYRRALAIDEKAVGPESAPVAEDLNNLGQFLSDRGDRDGAEPLLRRAVKIAEKTKGEDHPQFALMLSNLATLLYDKGHYAEAEPLFRRALAISESTLGSENTLVAGVSNNLAKLLIQKHDYTAAEPLLRHALAIDEKELGPEHPTVVTIRKNLTSLLEAKQSHPQ